MEPLTFEAVSRNPELLQALIRQARRERAEAIYRLIVEPVKSLFTVERSPCLSYASRCCAESLRASAARSATSFTGR